MTTPTTIRQHLEAIIQRKTETEQFDLTYDNAVAALKILNDPDNRGNLDPDPTGLEIEPLNPGAPWLAPCDRHPQHNSSGCPICEAPRA